MEEDSYTTGQAARILEVTDPGVRKMIDRDEPEARQDERGRHLIPQRAAHAVLKGRRSTSPISAEEAARASEEARELRERVQDLQRQLYGPAGAGRPDRGEPKDSPHGGCARSPAAPILGAL